MRQLSYSQAATCETAKHSTCRCRCGGRLHGARRIQPGADRSEYEALPPSDPHSLHPQQPDMGLREPALDLALPIFTEEWEDR